MPSRTTRFLTSLVGAALLLAANLVPAGAGAGRPGERDVPPRGHPSRAPIAEIIPEWFSPTSDRARASLDNIFIGRVVARIGLEPEQPRNWRVDFADVVYEVEVEQTLRGGAFRRVRISYCGVFCDCQGYEQVRELRIGERAMFFAEAKWGKRGYPVDGAGGVIVITDDAQEGDLVDRFNRLIAKDERARHRVHPSRGCEPGSGILGGDPGAFDGTTIARTPVHAADYGDDRVLAAAADHLVLGQVLTAVPSPDSAIVDPAIGLRRTFFWVKLCHQLKGALPAAITVGQSGGIDPVSGERRLVAESPLFEPGETVLLALNRQPDREWYTIVGEPYGVVRAATEREADRLVRRFRRALRAPLAATARDAQGAPQQTTPLSSRAGVAIETLLSAPLPAALGNGLGRITIEQMRWQPGAEAALAFPGTAVIIVRDGALTLRDATRPGSAVFVPVWSTAWPRGLDPDGKTLLLPAGTGVFAGAGDFGPLGNDASLPANALVVIVSER